MTIAKRRCSVCGDSFPLEVFAGNGTTKAGTRKIRSWCKLCESKRVSQRNRKRVKKYRYLIVDCIDCDKTYSVRLEGDDCSELVAICDDCAETRKESFRSEKGNVTQQEAENASD